MPKGYIVRLSKEEQQSLRNLVSSGKSAVYKILAGYARWTLRLLADKAVEQELVPVICHETVRQVWKKELKPHLCRRYVIPPQQSEEFVMHMEDVSAIYYCPYDSELPVIYMDEQPVQWVKEMRVP